MHDPGPQLNGLIDYIYLLLRQFAGGPGPIQNNLMRFGLPAVCLAVLFLIAWNRRRETESRRERWLLLGFGLGFLREFLMFLHVSQRLLRGGDADSVTFLAAEPLEHALSLLAIGTIAGSFIGYLLQNRRLALRYTLVVAAATVVSFFTTTAWWGPYFATHPGAAFHQTWPAWLFHIVGVILITAAVLILRQAQGWLRNTVQLAMFFFLIGEAIMILNIATNRAYAPYACPIGNSFHILAMPLLGYIYLREQSLEKRRVDGELRIYRENLEDLVAARTRELTSTNRKLSQEIIVRERTEAALARLSRQHALLLESAGEGIFGVDLDGLHTFVNRAAADMLGYEPAELVGKPSHTTWHHSYADGSPYPDSECPLHNGYKTGQVRRGDEQIFWRRDGTPFPARYISTPIFEEGRLTGAVVVFQDIGERKLAEAEIIRQNAELTTLNAIAATISRSLELDALLATAIETVLGELDVEAGCIFLCEGPDAPMALKTHLSNDPDGGCCALSAEHAARDACYQVAQAAVDAMDPVIRELPPSTIERGAPPPLVQQPHDMVGIPLVAKGRALGAMSLLVVRDRYETDHNLNLLTAIGQQIGIALENARLYLEAENAAALEERQRIAADMHDGLAQTLSYVGHQIDTMMDRIDSGDGEQAMDIGEEVRGALDRTATELRKLISSLQSKPEPPKSLQSLIGETIAASHTPADTPVIFHEILSEPYYPTPDEQQQVQRILQEAILNAQRHAQANRIQVTLAAQDGSLAATIADDGRGFAPAAPAGHDGHFGLSIMRARAARLDGSLAVSSHPGRGTQITLRWPRSDAPSPTPSPALPIPQAVGGNRAEDHDNRRDP